MQPQEEVSSGFVWEVISLTVVEDPTGEFSIQRQRHRAYIAGLEPVPKDILNTLQNINLIHTQNGLEVGMRSEECWEVCDQENGEPIFLLMKVS